ncbi:MAG: FAD-dependent thymidylate synthase [Bdellovibrionota bacterium]
MNPTDQTVATKANKDAADAAVEHKGEAVTQEMTEARKESLLRRIPVDDGYVQLTDFMGAGDLSVVNAARVSFGKRKDVFEEADAKLIRYLARHKHMSPFRHMQFSFLIHTSEVVCRQLYKHQVGCAFTSGEMRESATVWNEISGRYVQFDNEFHKITAFEASMNLINRLRFLMKLLNVMTKLLLFISRQLQTSYET